MIVGFSGGLDSMVLLHALTRVVSEPDRILALHVDHGLHPRSRNWADFCRRSCQALGVECRVRNVSVQRQGRGPEAAARKARYAVFEEVTGESDLLLLAHHLDDQFETLLFRAFRGVDGRGRAGMPVERPLGAGRLVRPLIDVPRWALREYAEAEGLEWIEDSSNADTSFDRNYIRNRIVPLIEDRWPRVAANMVRIGKRVRADSDLLDLYLDRDLQRIEGGSGELPLESLAGLDDHHRERLILRWIERRGYLPPSVGQVRELLAQTLAVRPGAHTGLSWNGVSLRVYRGSLWIVPQAPPRQLGFIWNPATPVMVNGRCLAAFETKDRGLRIGRETLEVRFREGGERIRPEGRQGSHPLKKLFQEWGIPPWERDRVPLIYRGGRLVAVPGKCICHGESAGVGAIGLVLDWRAEAQGPL